MDYELPVIPYLKLKFVLSAKQDCHLTHMKGSMLRGAFGHTAESIIKLHQLHKKMDEAVLSAYGWDRDGEAGPAITLRHDFYEVDYLPENDNVRYTIHPEARREVLKRLLLLNHKIHAEEVKSGLWNKKGGKKKGNNLQSELGV